MTQQSDPVPSPTDPRIAELIAVVRNTLNPTDPSYCAEPLSIEDARYLLEIIDLFQQRLEQVTKERDEARQEIADAKKVFDTFDGVQIPCGFTVAQEAILFRTAREDANKRADAAERERDSLRNDYRNITETLHIADEATGEWRDKAVELHKRAEAAEATIARLKEALEKLVGASTRDELEQLEVGLGQLPLPAEYTADHIAAVHALLALASSEGTERQPS